MPDLDHDKNSPYPFLSRLSTETLKQILRVDFELEDSDTPKNDEFITCVMEVIAQREIETAECSKFDVDAGWRDFQQNYQPGEKGAASVCGEMVPDGQTKNNGQERQADLRPRRPRRAIQRVLRIAVIAAIVAGLCMVAASALEVNIFKMVAEWTQDIFQFRSETGTPQNEAYESGAFLEDDQTLKDLLTEESITQLVYPKWIPDGYVFLESSAAFDVEEPMFMSVYENENVESPITVLVVAHKEPQGMVAEKDVGDVITYCKNDIEHYIMTNSGILVSSWFTENLECSITGNISELEMKAMIDSIYEE